jgi:hypothetical protein
MNNILDEGRINTEDTEKGHGEHGEKRDSESPTDLPFARRRNFPDN